MPKTRLQNRHLKLRGSKWYLVLRVPKPLVSFYGKDTIVEATGESDIHAARRWRDVRVAALTREWSDLRLHLARATKLLTPDEISRALAIRLGEASEDRKEEVAGDLALDVLDRPRRGRDVREAAAVAHDVALGKFDDFLAASEKYLNHAELKDSSKALYRGIFKIAAKQFSSIQSVTKDTAYDFLVTVASSGTKSKLNNYCAALTSLWRYLRLDPSVWDKPKVKPGKATIPRAHWLDHEVVKLVQTAEPKLRQAIRIAAYTGAREEEIARLVYDADKDQLVFMDAKTKAGNRRIPCHPAIRDDVREWIKAPKKAQWIADNFMKHREKVVDQAIVIDGVTYHRVYHSFRHCVTTKLIEADVPEAMAQRVVGHARKGVTQGIYAKLVDPEKLRPYVNLISYEGL